MASRNKNKKMPVKRTKCWADQESDDSDSSESCDSTTSSSSENEDQDHNIPKFPVTQPLCNERAKDPSPVALLDMLAEVASATLKNDPIIAPCPLTKSPVVKAVNTLNSTRKPTLQSDLLSLDQIRMLSDKLLLNMFSDMTADELRRTYKYTCYLTPDKCQQTYSSFGNENRARMQMKTHLLGHIAELLAEANSPGRSQRIKFTAEPLPARKKRLAEQNGSKRRFIRKSSKLLRGRSKESQNVMKSKMSMICTRSKANSTSDASKLPRTKSKEDLHLNNRDKSALKGKISKVSSNKLNEHLKDNDNIAYKNERINGSLKTQNNYSLRSLKKKDERRNMVTKDSSTQEKQDKDLRTVENSDIGSDHSKSKKKQKLSVSDKNWKNSKLESSSVEEVVDTVDQPQHDHNYTWPSGKKKGIENFDYNSTSDEEIKENEDICSISVVANCDKTDPYESTCSFISAGAISPKAITLPATSPTPTPIFNMPVDPNVGHTVEVASDTGNVTVVKKDHIFSNKQKRVRRINKIVVPEEFESESSEFSEEEVDDKELEEVEVNHLPKSFHKNKQKKIPEKGSPEWERKLALKCIRMLRSKRKDERVALICKICKNKTFTAQATLMYHYRSHAGIKPFVCTICNTTFTRQHSLNYHMLIHNNKSRFTCMECGRKFRHPSHFKEHMRRHTGETPFECADCGLRFKTRNTYKRHLKTRHGKLLTATGIMLLSSEEFSKVKTTPRRRAEQQHRKDKETQWPEVAVLSKATETETKLLDL